jgi:hypothetical protein
VKIQTAWRAYYIRKIFQSRVPGNPKNQTVTENLRKSWQMVEQNLQDNALFLFRQMFKINPSLAQYYPFFKDEWNRISFMDYNGAYPEQSNNAWFILFRDIFYAQEEPVLLLPKLYCNLNNCLLKVINNDTYKEIPKVFNKLSPYTYTNNKKGYTIVAEGRTPPNDIIGPGRWRLRLIGSSQFLLAPRPSTKTDILSVFDVKEVRDYYIPNEHKTIMRHKVTVSDDHLTSLQITTSKPDVYVKLTIYDNGVEVLSSTGKGGAVIPAFIFLKDRTNTSSDSSGSRPGSKTSPIQAASSMSNVGVGRTSKHAYNNSESRNESLSREKNSENYLNNSLNIKDQANRSENRGNQSVESR